jgi:hypothetical protein
MPLLSRSCSNETRPFLITTKSGPYAAALAAELSRPGLDHLNLFQNVKEAVLAATGGAQQPWESNGIGRRVYLTGLPKAIERTKDSTSAQSPQISEAERTWPAVKDTTSIAVLEAFVDRYKDTNYGELARARIGELKKQQQQQEDEKKRAEAEAAKKRESVSPPKSAAEIMSSWDMIGTWATNCRRPPGNQNAYLSFVVMRNGRVSFEHERESKGIYDVSQARIAPDGSLEFTLRSASISEAWKYTIVKGPNDSRRIVEISHPDGSNQTIATRDIHIRAPRIIASAGTALVDPPRYLASVVAKPAIFRGAHNGKVELQPAHHLLRRNALHVDRLAQAYCRNAVQPASPTALEAS